MATHVDRIEIFAEASVDSKRVADAVGRDTGICGGGTDCVAESTVLALPPIVLDVAGTALLLFDVTFDLLSPGDCGE